MSIRLAILKEALDIIERFPNDKSVLREQKEIINRVLCEMISRAEEPSNE